MKTLSMVLLTAAVLVDDLNQTFNLHGFAQISINSLERYFAPVSGDYYHRYIT